MKKLIVCCVFVLLCTACGAEKNENTTDFDKKTNSQVTEQTEVSPAPTENRSEYSAKDVRNKMKSYISDDIDAGANIVLKSYDIATTWDTYQAIEKKDLNLTPDMWLMPEFQICQDQKSINMCMYFKGEDMADNAIEKVKVVCGNDEFSINSTHIQSTTSWMGGTSGYGFVDFIEIDKEENVDYTKNLVTFEKMLSSNEKIKLHIKFVKNSKKYTLSEYHIEIFKSMVKYYKEALTYQ